MRLLVRSSGNDSIMTLAFKDLHIRLARADECLRIREIEDRAGEMFDGLGLIDESLDEGIPIEALERSIALGQVWVACIDSDVPVGMVIVSVIGSSVYIEEMDVLPEYGRRRIGSRLLEYVCEWAADQGYRAATLSTFRDVPWNGPFYRRHGFRDLDPDEWSAEMAGIRKREIDHGLCVESRIFMKRELSA